MKSLEALREEMLEASDDQIDIWLEDEARWMTAKEILIAMKDMMYAKEDEYGN